MPDPNNRRDKALETIARELGETNKLLAKIERNTRPVDIKIHPYLKESTDAGSVSEGIPGQASPEQGAGPDTDFFGPYGAGTSDPYS